MSALTATDIEMGLTRLGVGSGDTLIVHSSLAAFGRVQHGAIGAIDGIRRALGPTGTLVVPTFTPQTQNDNAADPGEGVLFDASLPTPMGAIPNAVLQLEDCVRGTHPQVSVAAVGPLAQEICAPHRYSFAVGPDTAFGRMHDLNVKIALLGVGHNRNTFLHLAETLSRVRRLKRRRFVALIGDERVWIEVPDVGDDNDRFFPSIGGAFEPSQTGLIGESACQVMGSRDLVEFATPRLEAELREADSHLCE